MKKIIILIQLFTVNILFAQSSNFINERQNQEKNHWQSSLSDMIMVEGSYYRNLGNFGQVYNKATGLYLNYAKHFNNSYQLILKTGYTDFNVREESQSDSTSFKSIPVQIGGRYYVLPDRVMPYFSFMNGVNIISKDKDIDGDNNEETLIRYMWQVGFGVAVKVVKEVNIDICAKYNNNFYNPDAMMTSFEYSAGLSFNFGN